MKQRDLDDARALYLEILQGRDWNWWGRLSRPYGRGSRGLIIDNSSRRLILDDFEDWLEDLQKEEGGSDFIWARSYEKGLRGDEDKVRILIGGLRNRSVQWRERWSPNLLMSSLHHFSNSQSLKAFKYLLDAKGRHGRLEFKYHFPDRAF
jgi:hypothetical protein